MKQIDEKLQHISINDVAKKTLIIASVHQLQEHIQNFLSGASRIVLHNISRNYSLKILATVYIILNKESRYINVYNS